MAYGFNNDRSKVEMHSKAEVDAMIANEASTRSAADMLTDARIDVLVDHGTGGIEVREELWTSASGVIGGSINLSGDPDNYDCLELVVGDSAIKKIARIPVTGGVADISTGVGPNDVKVSSVQITRNGDNLSVSSADELEYAGSWSYSASGTAIPKIYAVYGIKYAQDCSAEVADIRVGYDGATRSIAGDMIRFNDESTASYLNKYLGIFDFRWIDGTINNETGAEGFTPGQWIHTENYCPVDSNKTYQLYVDNLISCQLNEYDENKNWIRYFGSMTTAYSYKPTDSSVKYIRFCARTNTTRTYPYEGYGLKFIDPSAFFFKTFAHRLSKRIITDEMAAGLNITSVANLPDNVFTMFSATVTATAVADLPVYGVRVGVIKFQPIDTEIYGTQYSMLLALNMDSNTFYIGKIGADSAVTWKNLDGHVNYTGGTLALLPDTDLNKFKAQTITFISPSWLTNSGGLPTDTAGYVVTLGSNTKNRIQFYITNKSGLVYKRHIVNPTAAPDSQTWSEWHPYCGSAWGGKSWYAYGTSMTAYTNRTLSNGVVAKGYAAYLPDLSGMTITNRGLGNSGIIPSKHGGLEGDNVYTRIMTLDDGKASADLITVEILPNDGTDKIGTVTDVWDGVENSSSETLMGCLANILRYLQENTNATIAVLIATPARYKAGDPSDTTTPEELLSWTNRVELVKQKCALYQVPVVSATDGCGLGFYRVGASDTTYVGDNIHLAGAGGYNLAKFFWGKLKNIAPWSTSAPE